MRVQTRPRGLLQGLKALARPRSLQSRMGTAGDRRNVRQAVLNKLGQLHWEKERLTQERRNWQGKIGEIDARLEEIQGAETDLERQFLGQLTEAPKQRQAGDGTEGGAAQSGADAPVVLRY